MGGCSSKKTEKRDISDSEKQKIWDEASSGVRLGSDAHVGRYMARLRKELRMEVNAKNLRDSNCAFFRSGENKGHRAHTNKPGRHNKGCGSW